MNKNRVELLLAAVLLLACVGFAQTAISLEHLWTLADEQVASLKIRRTAVEGAEHDVAVSAADRLPDRKLSESATAPRLMSLGFIGYPHVDGSAVLAVNMGLYELQPLTRLCAWYTGLSPPPVLHQY